MWNVGSWLLTTDCDGGMATTKKAIIIMANAPMTSSTAYTEEIHENICTAVTSSGVKELQSSHVHEFA